MVQDLARAATFVGRERELTELLALADRALQNRGGLALLVGEPGVGKTSIAEELAVACRQRGFRIHWGSCWEGDGQPPGWVWTQVLRSVLVDLPAAQLVEELGPAAGHLSLLIPELSCSAAGLTDDDPARARFSLYDALAQGLTIAARRAPLLVVLDDLHWADHLSVGALCFLAGQLRGVQLLVIAAYRDVEVDPDSPLASTRGELARLGRSIALGGLSVAEIDMLLAATMPGHHRPGLAAEVHRQSSGNPLFVGEVTRLLGSDQTWPGLPSGVRDVIASRLARFPPACRRLLCDAAVLGTAVELAELEALCGLDRAELLALLTEPLAARILRYDPERADRFEFTHALVRQGALDQLTPVQRAALHGRAGRALETVRAGHLEPYLARLASHFVQAAVLGDAAVNTEMVVGYCLAAGEQAHRCRAYEEAAHFLGHAARLLEQARAAPQRVCELLVELGEAQWRAGQAQQSILTHRRALAIARDIDDGDLFARAALGCCSYSVMYGPQEDLAATLEEARDRLAPGDSPRRIQVISRLAQELITWPARTAEAVALAAQAVAMTRRCAEAGTTTNVMWARNDLIWSVVPAEQRLALGAELLALADRSDEPELAVEAHLMRFTGAMERADRDLADAELARIRQLAVELGSPVWRFYADTRYAAIAILEGRYAEALQLLDQAQPWADRLGLNAFNEHGGPRIQAASVGFAVELPGFAQIAAECADLFEAQPMLVSLGGAACLALTQIGDHQRARRVFQLALARAQQSDTARHFVLLGLVMLAEACVLLPVPEAALTLYVRLAPYPDTVPVQAGVYIHGPVAHGLGLLSELLGRSDEAQRHFERALAISKQMRARPWTARIQLAWARLRAAQGDQQGSRQLLDEVRETAQQLGMTRLLNELGAVDSGPVLTDSVTAPPRVEASLCVQGGYVSIGYRGSQIRLRNSKGLRYLAALLAHPGVEQHVFDLVGLVDAPGEPGLDRRALGDAGPMLDAQAKAAYQRRLGQLRGEIEEAEESGDQARAASAQAEIDALVSELARAVGLGGRDRRAASTAEKARLNVTRALRSAITHISRAHPELGGHLDHCVRTGLYCCYDPEPAATVVWVCSNDRAGRGGGTATSPDSVDGQTSSKGVHR